MSADMQAGSLRNNFSKKKRQCHTHQHLPRICQTLSQVRACHIPECPLQSLLWEAILDATGASALSAASGVMPEKSEILPLQSC